MTEQALMLAHWEGAVSNRRRFQNLSGSHQYTVACYYVCLICGEVIRNFFSVIHLNYITQYGSTVYIGITMGCPAL